MSDDRIADKIDECLRHAAQAAAKALLDLQRLRDEPQAHTEDAYREIHDVISQLAAAHMLLVVGGLVDEPNRHSAA